jgi:hypothetical protein
LFAALAQANERNAEDKARIAALEARLARMDQVNGAPPASADATDQRLLERMDRLIDLNQRVLLAEHFRQPIDPALADGAAQGTNGCGDSADPREELRRLVERMYGGSSGFRGGLSVEQSEALKVLLRPERSLDAHNPWY